MKTATYNPHRWFFGYVTNMAGYDKKYEKAIREGIVWEYSEGKTDSLKEMYSEHRFLYDRMRRILTGAFNNELDIARKRVIAVLFSYLRITGYNPNMDYVKETARRAARTERFNAISLPKLRQLYKAFGEKYERKEKEWTDDTLNKIAADVANGIY